MASSRKKQDENNLKTLRNLAALPQNKFCFDCGQRGPTYVNVTVGSFVCTKCSGILRGITPPHRVKSISMATFTTEEIDSIRNKGNDYCRNLWLGLYEGAPPAFTDEQQVRDFMVEKYERKRYYLEKNMTKPEVPHTRAWNGQPTTNGTSTTTKLPNGTRNGFIKNNVNGTIVNGTTRSRPEVKSHLQNGANNNTLGSNSSFAVDFDKADIFSNTSTSSTGSSQNGFADFEHNQVYNASSNNTSNANEDDFSIFDLQFSSSLGPTLNRVPLFPKCAPLSNRWSMPTQTALNAWSTQPTPLNPKSGMVNSSTTVPLVNPTPPAAQDKYAALKDLDNEMKQHHQDVWSTSTTGSTGSLYSSSTPTTGSAYGSPSPQGSIFGSPSQGQFMSAFTNLQDSNHHTANPFGTSTTSPWGTTSNNNNNNTFANGSNGFNNTINGLQTAQAPSGYINPFRDQSMGKSNGLANGFQTVFPTNGLSSNVWGGNPFKVGAVTTTTMNSNNPFL